MQMQLEVFNKKSLRIIIHFLPYKVEAHKEYS